MAARTFALLTSLKEFTEHPDVVSGKQQQVGSGHDGGGHHHVAVVVAVVTVSMAVLRGRRVCRPCTVCVLFF